jgi:uncharacterized membrane protein YukC
LPTSNPFRIDEAESIATVKAVAIVLAYAGEKAFEHFFEDWHLKLCASLFTTQLLDQQFIEVCTRRLTVKCKAIWEFE